MVVPSVLMIPSSMIGRIPVSVPAVSMCVESSTVSGRVPGRTATRFPMSSMDTVQPRAVKLRRELLADLLLMPGRAVDRDQLEKRLHQSVAVDLVGEHAVRIRSHSALYGINRRYLECDRGAAGSILQWGLRNSYYRLVIAGQRGD